jgi:hypothetical protein
MESLEEKTIKTLFDYYLKNKIFNATIRKCLMELMDENKDIVEEYIKNEGLYHVYYRQQSTYPNNGLKEIQLIRSFVTIENATKWIIDYGRNVIEELEDYYCGSPIVLTIIYKDNDCNKDIYDDSTNIYWIALKGHPTYAFSEKAYDMLLEEHYNLFYYDWCLNIIPGWIYWVKENEIIRGCPKTYLLDLLTDYSDETVKKSTLEEYDVMQKILPLGSLP